MKYLADFSKTVEAGVDPRLESKNEYHVNADLFLAVSSQQSAVFAPLTRGGCRRKEILQGFGGGDG